MKMYVWNEPYEVSYGSSICFAVAETVEQAREIAARAWLYHYGFSKDKPPKEVLGEPTRVYDLPCAEWHEWSE